VTTNPESTNSRAEIVRRVSEIATLRGEFTLRSGQIASEYFDKYQFEADPTLLEPISVWMTELLDPRPDIIAGLELGAIPLATAISLRTGLPATFVRKKAKPYGTRKAIEGPDVAGKAVVVIEDVVTTGGQIALSTAELRALGADIRAALCVIDRHQGGAPALLSEGITLLSLLTASDLNAAA
jgi:orotate phosphoribosyltransferase